MGRHKIERLPQTCPTCGKTFICIKYEKRFCSVDCANEYRRINSKKQKTEERKKCNFCGEEFEFKGNKKFCSDRCRRKAYNISEKRDKPDEEQMYIDHTCDGCIYHKPITGGKCCHHLLETGMRRKKDGDKCLSKTILKKRGGKKCDSLFLGVW